MAGKLRKKISIMLIILGAALLLYPSVSNYINSLHQTRIITDYSEAVEDKTQAEIDAIWDEAVKYNEEIKLKNCRSFLTDAQKSKYEATLDATGTGVMGYIEIPKIGLNMPIYHGVEEGVLAIAAGHLEWSSLPVGGKGTHCVLSGHRGLPSAKLFTDLPELNPGDTFVVRVLDRALTYRVDQIKTVLPDDISELMPVKGKDYCTLVTCTPYGINTHRLLVRGVRVKNGDEAWSAIPNKNAIVPSLIILFLLGTGIKSLLRTKTPGLKKNS